MDDVKQSYPLNFLPDDWQSSQDKYNIVCRSEGHLTAAKTIIRCIRHRKYVPSDSLNTTLSNQGPLGSRHFVPSTKSFLMHRAYAILDEHAPFLEYDQASLNKSFEEIDAQSPPAAACPPTTKYRVYCFLRWYIRAHSLILPHTKSFQHSTLLIKSSTTYKEVRCLNSSHHHRSLVVRTRTLGG
ncbi:hypothetical protein BJ165DRAFT_230048 [Panaeolus papilionaceus]|nr:hypothetical protein BJ165DRAFT_230048 [Panaeolus papilionaceus]